MQFITPVEIAPGQLSLSLSDKLLVLGSCFADNIGSRMLCSGFNACVNPFGTLYNPASIASALSRLSDPVPYTEADCVEMGAGAGLICSWEHHTSFARSSAAEFLESANAALEQAAAFWKTAGKLIVTLGTAFVWELADSGRTVSNCLKRPAAEFRHRRLTAEEVREHLESIVESAAGRVIIFTVSPVRHMGDGAHEGQLSKSTLLLALDSLIAAHPGQCSYFPAYEILLDELRDYRFYAADMKHPSEVAVNYIWERFVQAAVPSGEHARLQENEKAARHLAHRPIH